MTSSISLEEGSISKLYCREVENRLKRVGVDISDLKIDEQHTMLQSSVDVEYKGAAPLWRSPPTYTAHLYPVVFSFKLNGKPSLMKIDPVVNKQVYPPREDQDKMFGNFMDAVIKESLQLKLQNICDGAKNV